MDGLGLSSMMETVPAPRTLSIQTSPFRQKLRFFSRTRWRSGYQRLEARLYAGFQPRFKVLGWISGLLSVSDRAIPKRIAGRLAEATLARGVCFSKNLKSNCAGTRLITVMYSNPDPKLAADVVNHLIQSLRISAFRPVYCHISGFEWLSGQLSICGKRARICRRK